MRIDIDYDPARVVENRRRWDAAFHLGTADRPPVGWGACPRLMLARRNSSFGRMFGDPIDQLHEIVKNWKWIAETLPGDMISDFSIVVQPQFENASNSGAHGCSIVWDDLEPPQALPAITSVAELENYEPPPVETTLWGRMFRYYAAMRRWLDEGRLAVTMRGEPIDLKLELHVGGESPFMIATDLCGGNIYSWMYEAPEAVHRLLEIITERFISCELQMRQLCGLPRHSRIFVAEDTAQIISLDDFREFVVPYTGQIYQELAGPQANRIIHMCGRHTHLYPALVEDLKIAGIWGYGAANDPAEVAAGLGGKCWLLGNLDPILLREGPVSAVVAATEHLLENLLPQGGFIVGDGYNLIPDTPISHLQAVVDVVGAHCQASTAG